MALKFFNSKNNFHVNIVFQLQCCPLKLFMYQHISPMDHTTTPFFTRSEEKAISLVEAGKMITVIIKISHKSLLINRSNLEDI